MRVGTAVRVGLDEALHGARASRLATFVTLACLTPGFVLSLITAAYGIDDLNTLVVFHADEVRIVRQVLRNLADDDLNPHGYFNYGYVYHALGFWVAKGYAAVGAHVDARFVAFELRLIGLASFALSLWVFARCLHKLGVQPWLRAAFTVLLGSLPSLVHFREFIHPDTLQMLFVVLAVDVLVRPTSGIDRLAVPALRQVLARAAVAGACAGLAFGTKYSGLFVLPLVAGFVGVWVVAAALTAASRPSRRRALGAGFCALGAAGVAFVLAWLLSNPYVLAQWPDVAADIARERALLARGRGWEESPDGSRWWLLLGAELPAGVLWALFASLLLGWVAAMAGLFVPRGGGVRERLRPWLVAQRGPELLLLVGYVAGAALHLYVTVNSRRPQYVFHLLPVALALAAAGVQCALERLPFMRVRAAIGVALVVGAAGLAHQALPASAAKTTKYAHPQLALGRLLASRYADDTRILADMYTYLPATLSRTRVARGVLQRDIDRFKPRVVVLNRAMSGRFNWKQNPKRSMTNLRFRTSRRDGAAKYRAFHDRLFGPDSAFEVVHETPDAVVLERRPAAP